jgi:hypothetical protein
MLPITQNPIQQDNIYSVFELEFTNIILHSVSLFLPHLKSSTDSGWRWTLSIRIMACSGFRCAPLVRYW